MKIVEHLIEVDRHVEISHDDFSGYEIKVNGEVVLEHLAEDELKEISVGDVIEMYLKGR